MTYRKPKCLECGKREGSNPEQCELCWMAAMDRDEAARDRENDRRIDEARGK